MSSSSKWEKCTRLKMNNFFIYDLGKVKIEIENASVGVRADLISSKTGYPIFNIGFYKDEELAKEKSIQDLKQQIQEILDKL